MTSDTTTRYAGLVFVGSVTALLLAAVATRALAGPAGLAQAAVYALAAGFGLEYLAAVWTRREPPPAARRGRRRAG